MNETKTNLVQFYSPRTLCVTETGTYAIHVSPIFTAPTAVSTLLKPLAGKIKHKISAYYEVRIAKYSDGVQTEGHSLIVIPSPHRQRVILNRHNGPLDNVTIVYGSGFPDHWITSLNVYEIRLAKWLHQAMENFPIPSLLSGASLEKFFKQFSIREEDLLPFETPQK